MLHLLTVMPPLGRTVTTHTHLSSHTGTTPPSTAPSSLVNYVLTKSLAVSKPSLVKGLYWKLCKTVSKKIPTVSETIGDEDSDIEIIEGGSDENQGAIELEDENQSTNIEFQHAQDTPVKVKQLKKKAKVNIYSILYSKTDYDLPNQYIVKEELIEEEPIYQAIKMSRKIFKNADLPPLALEFWCGQFVTTAYWWVSMSDNPWCINSSILCTNLQTIWEAIYQIPYTISDDSAVYNLVKLKLKPLIKKINTDLLFFIDDQSFL